jgi:uncharacterized membrane protein YsdA (DUF1294 family)
MYIQLIPLGIFVAVNIFSFIVMGYDKRKAIRGGATERTPEGFMFFLAAWFGSIGVYAGMFVFRHKIRKWYFQLGVPLLILQNLATVYLVWEIFIIN